MYPIIKSRKTLIDAPEGVVIHGGGNLGNFFQQFLEQGAGEKVIGFGQDTGELRIVLLDVAHGFVDLGTDVLGFGQPKQEIEPGVGHQIEDAFGVISGGIVQAAAAPGQVALPMVSAGFFEPGALRGKTDFGEVEEDEAEDGRGVFLGFQAGVGAELVGGFPKTIFKGAVGVVFSDGAIQCIIGYIRVP